MRGALLLLLSACTDVSSSDCEGADLGTLTWHNFGESFITHHCQPCHSSQVEGAQRYGAPDNVTFDDLESVLVRRETILLRVVDDRDMPPAGGVLELELEKLDHWLTCTSEFL